MSITLTQVDKRKFDEDGYVVVEHVLTPEQIEHLAAKARSLLGRAADSGQVVDRFGAGEQPVLRKVRGLVRSDPDFRELATSPAMVDVVEELFGEEALIFRDVLVVKPAHEGAAFEWHQDSAYWDIDPPALISAWVALADVPESAGCLTVIPRTQHKPVEHVLFWGKNRHVPKPLTRLLRKAVSLAGTGDNPDGAGGSKMLDAVKRLVLDRGTRLLPFLGKLGDYAVDERQLSSLGRPVALPVKAGSVVFFHSLLLHASYPNRSDADRISPIISYMGRSFRFTGRGQADFLPVRPVG
jgi:ectoine hydroxylase-related dioxygenase (phytanoyl-CoA dioxygenase family)